MYYLRRIAVGGGIATALTQVPTDRPTMLVFWGGILVAVLAGVSIADEQAS